MLFRRVAVELIVLVLVLNSERSLCGTRSSDVGAEDPQSSWLP